MPKRLSRTPDHLVRLALAAFFVAMLAACRPADVEETFVEPRTGMELVRISAGTFVMGSPLEERGREDQEVQHEVTISRDFFLGRTEVTQAQWEKVLGARPSHFASCGPDCPVENVSYLDVQRFLDELGSVSGRSFRLPTEAEWEYACRAGTSTAFATGAELSTEQANYDGDPPMPGWPPGIDRGRPLPVASFPGNAWGLYDLHGNVWEWTADEPCPYPRSPTTDPRLSCGSDLRVIRGGSWHFGPDSARCALRYTHRPQDVGPSLGFRVAMSASGG